MLRHSAVAMMGMFAAFSRWIALMEKTTGGLAHVDSERLAQIEALAAEVFEGPGQVNAWLSSPNIALGGKSPRSLCSSSAGASHVRRLLRAIEFGLVV